MSVEKMELRAYVFIDRMQPQYAAYVATTVQGDIPTAGMSELFVEVAPGNKIFTMMDVVLKASQVKPASLVVEREFGMLEVHSYDQAAVQSGGKAILDALGLSVEDRVKPQVVSAEIISNVDAYEAQLINKFRKGSMLVPGETLLIMETAPAAYIVVAANEAEKAANIKIVMIRNVGRFGRMIISGSESEILAAKDAAVAVIGEMQGR